jgi:hypothetical protein
LGDRDLISISLTVNGEGKYSGSATSAERRERVARRFISIREKEGDWGAALS